jgi:hypothetical protein
VTLRYKFVIKKFITFTSLSSIFQMRLSRNSRQKIFIPFSCRPNLCTLEVGKKVTLPVMEKPVQILMDLHADSSWPRECLLPTKFLENSYRFLIARNFVKKKKIINAINNIPLTEYRTLFNICTYIHRYVVS